MMYRLHALRFWQLFWGLCLYGFSMALMLRANLGLIGGLILAAILAESRRR